MKKGYKDLLAEAEAMVEAVDVAEAMATRPDWRGALAQVDAPVAIIAGSNDRAVPAQDQREANVFRLAAMIVRSRFPQESASLMQASERYFALHPEERLPSEDVVRRGWVLSLPRLRDMLSRQLYNH